MASTARINHKVNAGNHEGSITRTVSRTAIGLIGMLTAMSGIGGVLGLISGVGSCESLKMLGRGMLTALTGI